MVDCLGFLRGATFGIFVRCVYRVGRVVVTDLVEVDVLVEVQVV
jgi:hypothetical protein